MPPKRGVVEEHADDDPDVVDDGKPRNQYEQPNVPLGADVGDQRAAEDKAAGRSQRRRRARDQLNPGQIVQGGNIYDRPGIIPAGDRNVQAADNGYVEMQLVEATRAADQQQLGVGGGEHAAGAVQGVVQGEYNVVPNGEIIAHVGALEGANEDLSEQAEAAEAAQNAQAARNARQRKFTILNGVLGGVSFLGTIGALLFAFFTQPRSSDGPIAVDVDGGDKLDPTQKVSIDVAGQALKGTNGKNIDKNSIELASHDKGDRKKMTITNVGTWTVKSDGNVEFTPDAKFPGGPVSIVYSIADTDGERSPRAQIRFGFRSKALPGTGGPLVKDFEETHTVADTVVIDVAGAAKPGPGGGAVKADSVILIGADDKTPKEYFQRGIGTWTAGNDGKITFVPIVGFLGGGTRQAYTIADANGNTSDSAPISLSFYKRPRVFNILTQVDQFTTGQAVSVNVADGTAGVPKPIPDPAFTIDPKSVILTGVMKSEGEARGPDATAKAKMKQLVVAGEGTWDASDPAGKVTFTPDAALTGDPHPITYQIADSKSIYSNVGTLIMSGVADKVVAALGKINNLDDAAFWSMYETKVIKADLGNDPVGKLLLMRSVTSELWLNTRGGLATKDRDTVLTRRDGLIRGVLGPDFKNWRKGNPGDTEGPLSPEKLFTLSKAYDDQKVGLPKIPLATRYIRLTYIHMMLGFFARYMDNQSKTPLSGGGNRS